MKGDYSEACVHAERENIFDAVWCITHQQYARECARLSPPDRVQSTEEKHYGGIAMAVHERLTSRG